MRFLMPLVLFLILLLGLLYAFRAPSPPSVVSEPGTICAEGYFLLGDICEPAPPGYVETRTPCEIGVDAQEAAGVEQDYLAEREKCRRLGQ